ncbi:DUF4870 domain-containing protein [Salibacterium aidingense]|uniref:DUF4870 domain-containing protein n=1 Tax=Salibacterium aidingense TaxID=384933 RepID=UPI00041B6E18|nr:DUF4870 domain-containing protein [Salibacterium aidingense]
MSLSVPIQDRIIAAGVYTLSLLLPIPLLAILIAYLLYRLLKNHSSFIEKHVKQNINFITSLHIYLLVLFLFQLAAANLGGGLEWLIEKVPLIGITLTLGGITSIFFLIIGVFLFTAVLLVLILFALFGQWYRLPLLIRFVK